MNEDTAPTPATTDSNVVTFPTPAPPAEERIFTLADGSWFDAAKAIDYRGGATGETLYRTRSGAYVLERTSPNPYTVTRECVSALAAAAWMVRNGYRASARALEPQAFAFLEV
jgi:hypothetical protein